MAKIQLGARPKNFKHTVKFQMLDGTMGSVEVLFKYRTKKEFGEFIDELMESAKIQPPPATGDEEPKPFSMTDMMEKTAGANADYILQVIEGWNLDGELTRDNVQAMADVYPAAAAAIMETYRTACVEGRLGN
jgi:hypothetical protein